jgi:type II secretory ATPase GspE/PulE/Tfp pilus assembly ATPase PilB-like protein
MLSETLDMDQVKIDPRWALRVPANLAIRRQLLPFTMDDDRVLVACSDPNDGQAIQALERYLALPVTPIAAEIDSLSRAIDRIFREPLETLGSQPSPSRVHLHSTRKQIEESDAEDVVALGDEIFHAALIRSATDIHIEPGENEVRIRLRVDGLLEEYLSVPHQVHLPLISRFKVMAGMDIAERRAPQDGRFTLGKEPNSAIDVRVATIPTKVGERMTMRLLAMQAHHLTMKKLGMLPDDLQVFEDAVTQPNGLILLTGPTGCGKTTTLYAALRRLLDLRSLNMITIEDPVEYLIDGISQVEVDAADKVSFHKALRSLLRHDPDVIMIGEIRDEETAEIAIKAALTGHLVFSTLHTNSAITSVTRLLNMGVQPFLLSAVARLFTAQRLVRKICPHCRTETNLTTEQAAFLRRPSLAGLTIFESPGCKYCAGSGIAGRTGIFEQVRFDNDIAEMLSQEKNESEIKSYLLKRNHRFLIDDAISKLSSGITSFKEIATVVNLQ